MTTEYGYLYARDQDLVLQTAPGFSNKLILGDDLQFLSGDKIGLGGEPTSDWADYGIQTHKNVLFDNTHALLHGPAYATTSETQLTSSNLIMRISPEGAGTRPGPELNSARLKLDALGVLENRLVIADSIKVYGETLSNVHVRDFYKVQGSNLYNMVLDTQYANSFSEHNLFMVDDVKFEVARKIVNFDCNMTLVLSTFLPEQQNVANFPLSNQRDVNIHLLRNINPQNVPSVPDLIATTTLFQNVFIVEARSGPDGTTHELDMVVTNNQSSFFRVGGMFNIKNVATQTAIEEQPQNVLVLLSKQTLPGEYVNDITHLRLVFGTPDPNEKVEPYLRPTLSRFAQTDRVSCFLFPLDLYKPPGGLNGSAFVPFRILEAEANEETDPASGLTELAVNYLIETPGAPYVLDYLLNEQSHIHYIGQHIYILDDAADQSRIWYLERFEIIEGDSSSKRRGRVYLRNYQTDAIDKNLIRQPRTVQALLFRLCRYNRFGDTVHKGFLPFNTDVAIASAECPEKLTVGGTMSCRDAFYLYDSPEVSDNYGAFAPDTQRHVFGIRFLEPDGAALGDYMSLKDRKTLLHKPTVFEQPVHFAQDMTLDAAFLGKSLNAQTVYADGAVLHRVASVPGLERRDKKTLHGSAKLLPFDPVRSDLPDARRLRVGRYLGVPPHHFARIESLIYEPPTGMRITLDRDLPGTDNLQLYTPYDPGSEIPEKDLIHLKGESLNPVDPIRIRLNLDTSHHEFLVPGRYYAYENDLLYPLMLTELKRDRKGQTLTLKTVDNRPFSQDPISGSSGALVPLDTFCQPRVGQYPDFPYAPRDYPYHKHSETGLTVAFRVVSGAVEIVLRGPSRLWDLSNPHFYTSFVNKIYLSIGTYELEGIKRDMHLGEKIVYLRTKFARAEYMKTYRNATATYAITGVPARVESAQFDDTQLWAPTLVFEDAVFARLFQQYPYVHIIDSQALTWKLHGTSQVDPWRVIVALTPARKPAIKSPADRITLSRERHVFVIPFVPFRHMAPDRLPLGINTDFAREMLTVAGQASCERALRLYDPQQSAHALEFKYANDVLRIGGIAPGNPTLLEVTPSNMHVALSHMAVDGEIAARRFYNTSDARLKSDIREIEGSDLERLAQLRVKTYEMDGRRERGFVAQDVERVFPEFVHRKPGVIPWNTGRIARILSDTQTLSFENGERVTRPENLVYTVLAGEADAPFALIRISGLRDEHLVVDQMSILVTAFAAMQRVFLDTNK